MSEQTNYPEIPEKEKNKIKEKSIGRELLSWISFLLIVVALTWFVVTFIGVRTKVSGHSMEPSLHHQDQLLVDKISYRFSDPERYDIIVFPYAHERGVYYIKRIIGMPGETIQIQDGEVYIDGELLGEEYGAEPMIDPGIAANPITLGEDEYFVLGDNRNHSTDSRSTSVGVLKRADLIGKAWVRIFPFDRIGVVKHE